MLGGNALKLAADAVIEKGKAVASFVLEASPSDITFENGRFQIAGTDRGVSLVEVAYRKNLGSASTASAALLPSRRAIPMAVTFARSRSNPKRARADRPLLSRSMTSAA
jgi:hypothetical protein